MSDIVPGYFDFITPPSTDLYSFSTVMTKTHFNTHYYASVRMVPLEEVWVIELGGGGIWFGIYTAHQM